jgi:hypothetical protein
VLATKFIPEGTQIIIEKSLVSVTMPEVIAGQGFKIADMVADIEAEFQALVLSKRKNFLVCTISGSRPKSHGAIF